MQVKLYTMSAPEAVRKTRGRPRKLTAAGDTTGLSRELIIEKAVELAKTERLSEISMVRLAKEFGVVPGLIHYYLGSRDDLISGVVNHYFSKRTESMPQPSGDWQADVRKIARAVLANMLKYRGIADYIATHNRFRLFQKVLPGETDYGLEFFNNFADVLRQGGLSNKAAALGYHLLMQYLVSSAMSEISRLTPGKHENFILAQLEGLDKDKYSGALYVAKEFARLESDKTFNAGLDMLIDGIARLK